jgi:hypothetical protein
VAIPRENPSESRPDQFLADGFAPGINLGHRPPIAVCRDRFDLHVSLEYQGGSEFLGAIPEILAPFGTVHPVEPDPFTTAVMQHGDAIAILNADNLSLPSPGGMR